MTLNEQHFFCAKGIIAGNIPKLPEPGIPNNGIRTYHQLDWGIPTRGHLRCMLWEVVRTWYGGGTELSRSNHGGITEQTRRGG